MIQNKKILAGLLACLVIIIASISSLISGPMAIPAVQSLLAVLDLISGGQLNSLNAHQTIVVQELRLPRTLLALFLGALLAVCGAVTQGVFRNPLADPGVIGVSSGAGLGAALAIVVFPTSLAFISTPLAAFVGGLLTTLLVYRLAQSSEGTSVLILLLAGIAISAFTGAVVGFLSFIANDQALRDLTLWGMGSLSGANFRHVALTGISCIILLFFYMKHASALNALLLGEAEAHHLGIDVERVKLRLILLTAAGIGIAVSMAGMIGFIGLVVPHLIRLTLGPDHRYLLPLSALTGAALLLIADIVARQVLAPAELPVGLLTALIGAPFFAALLLQQRRRLSLI
ncbi:Hemin ABC transporter, permease protein [Methylophaga lonarensis MPL]|uniref:Hemin ABC transporter, permease protein n=1 Tax=Methylophaga lonarensis MPL TaxID=1286106 RepID=M7PUM6_9GAMM|nr:iron ABC transporter permease [Methylophaga lonarensis]EMR14164.1 Hemin ABC transporter, permease protein [Methylophaga lonarensis MPL]